QRQCAAQRQARCAYPSNHLSLLFAVDRIGGSGCRLGFGQADGAQHPRHPAVQHGVVERERVDIAPDANRHADRAEGLEHSAIIGDA
ncbi:hypothetical protein CN633_31970, partial [Bacillus toyonensis]